MNFIKEKKHIIIYTVLILVFVGFEGFKYAKTFLDNTALNNARLGYQKAIEELYTKVESANCQPLSVQIGDGKTTTIKKSDCK